MKQFCGNNKQVVKGVHCQCNVNTTDKSLYTNEQWIKDTERQKKVVHCQCTGNTIFYNGTSLITERVLDLMVIYWKYNILQ